ncbi:MAG TPA: DUF6265 family protein [Gemmatimonadaceae bacterium]|nr:DUF6265 family protein [Gemmatimonadaceae bacterium]
MPAGDRPGRRIVTLRWRVHVRMLILACCIPALAAGSAAGQSASLQDLGWLPGCWEVQRGTLRTIEKWNPVANGEMAGESRTVVSGVERESEKLRLFVRGDSVVYEATPSRQRVAEFVTASTTGPEIVFANPAHDFPQRIIYRRVGSDSLVARIEGNRGGRPAAVSFPFRKITCPGG